MLSWQLFEVSVCIQQDYMEQHFERMKVQMKEASESVQKLQEDIQREVCTIS